MANGDVLTIRIPTELDYLAPPDTSFSNVPSGSAFTPANADNILVTMVDVSGRNSKRKVVLVVIGRSLV